MEPTSLAKLMKEEGVSYLPNGLSVRIHHSWIVEGEDRLSYTTLIRLIECCREHHWQTDILPRIQGVPLDSICKSIKANLMKPIIVGSVISIIYRVSEVRQKGYLLKFSVWNSIDQTLCAEFDLVSVFYDPRARRSVSPPANLFSHLTNLSK